MHSNIYEPILYNVLTFHFAITSSSRSRSLSDLNFDSRPHGCNRAKSAAPVILQSSQKVQTEFDKSLGLVDLMNLILILSHLNIIQERDLYLSYFVKKELRCWHGSDIYRWILFKLCLMIDINELCMSE